MAPPPPPQGKKQRLTSSSESESQDPETHSLLVMFDELVRNEKVLTEGCESKFLHFANNQGLCRKRWEAAEIEVQRLSIELQKSEQEVRRNLVAARQLHSTETDLRKRAEYERDLLGQKWELVRDLMSDQGQSMNDETRLMIAKVDASISTIRRPQGNQNIFSPGGHCLSPLNEYDTTSDSLINASDLIDNTRDNTRDALGADESRLRSGRNYKRKSSGGVAQLNRREKRSRSKGSVIARKSLEAMAAARKSSVTDDNNKRVSKKRSYEERNIDDYVPSAPAVVDDVAWKNACNVMTPSVSAVTVIERHASAATLTPTNHSTTTLVPTTPYTPANPVMRTYSNAGMNRNHQFVQKNEYKRETCGPCQKRIKFGKMVYKCRECRAVCHPECKDQVPLPCVPTGSAQKTPSRTGLNRGCQLADFVPHTSPMVPALIVHCVNEIEARGLTEVGLYRVPGSEKEVKDLKEKFFAGRGCPNLSHYDIHTLTGVVKDFLRSLKEPLITHSSWHVFTQAATNPDVTDAMSELYQAISQLPKPNRETLAFLVLHMQKITESKETKMTTSNLARTIGITVVGYSSADPSPEEILAATQYQTCTMEKLIQIDSDYWNTYLSGSHGEDLYSNNRILSPNTPETIFKMHGLDNTTPMRMSMRNGKVYEAKAVPQATTGKIFSSPVML